MIQEFIGATDTEIYVFVSITYFVELVYYVLSQSQCEIN